MQSKCLESFPHFQHWVAVVIKLSFDQHSLFCTILWLFDSHCGVSYSPWNLRVFGIGELGNLSQGDSRSLLWLQIKMEPPKDLLVVHFFRTFRGHVLLWDLLGMNRLWNFCIKFCLSCLNLHFFLACYVYWLDYLIVFRIFLHVLSLSYSGLVQFLPSYWLDRLLWWNL